MFVRRYVECVIHAAPVRGSSSEEAGSVMCVIRRCEDASAALLPVDGGPPAIAAKPSDHIVFRLDSNFTILCQYHRIISRYVQHTSRHYRTANDNDIVSTILETRALFT